MDKIHITFMEPNKTIAIDCIKGKLFNRYMLEHAFIKHQNILDLSRSLFDNIKQMLFMDITDVKGYKLFSFRRNIYRPRYALAHINKSNIKIKAKLIAR